jgi:hypothetical protein
MPKIYRCNKIDETGNICNETNENNFNEGRYTTCKKCRLKFMIDYNKLKKEEKQNQNTTKIDPDNHIRELIEDTISNVSLIKNQTIPNIIRRLEKDITEECLNFEDKIKIFEAKFEDSIKKFEDKISSLENENIALKIQLLNFKECIQKSLNEKL